MSSRNAAYEIAVLILIFLNITSYQIKNKCDKATHLHMPMNLFPIQILAF